MFKECVNKSESDSLNPLENEIEPLPTIQTSQPIILNKDSIAIDVAEKMPNDGKSGFQSSSPNVMNLSISNGKIKDVNLESKSIPDKSKGLQNEGEKDDIGRKSSILMDLLKPLDGKNIDDIEEESSSVLSSSTLKV